MSDNNVYVEYREYRRIIEPEPDDDWDREEEDIDTDFINIYECSPYKDSFYIQPVSCNNIEDLSDYGYLVYASYSDGDTFGTTHGHIDMICVFDKYSDAERAQDDLVKDSYDMKYKPWTGYFASLSGFHIKKIRVVKN